MVAYITLYQVLTYLQSQFQLFSRGKIIHHHCKDLGIYTLHWCDIPIVIVEYS